MPRRSHVFLVPVVLAWVACGSSTTTTGESPLADLTSRLPSPARLITGVSGLGEAVPSAVWTALTGHLDLIDAIKESWCHARTAVDGGSISIVSAQLADEVVTQQTLPAVAVTRTFTVSGGSAQCAPPGTSFTLRLDFVAYGADDAVIAPPWRPGERIAKALMFGRLADTDRDTVTDGNLAFVVMSGLPIGPLAAPDDFAHMPRPGAGLDLVDAGGLTMVFRPQNVAAGIGFGGLAGSELPEVLTVVADLSDAGRRSLLALARWTSPTDRPIAFDLRVADGATLTGAVVVQRSAGTDLFGPFFVDLGGVDVTSGFALDGANPADLLEAWDGARQVTHTHATQGSFTVPTGFSGWPGSSSTWALPFGQGRSAAFAGVLGGLPPVAGWFGS